MNQPLVNFAKPDKDAVIQKIQDFVDKEFGLNLGLVEADDLMSYYADEVGPSLCGQGLREAQAVLRQCLDDIGEAIDTLAEPVRVRGR